MHGTEPLKKKNTQFGAIGGTRRRNLPDAADTTMNDDDRRQMEFEAEVDWRR